MSKSNPQDHDKYVVRLPNGMRDRVKASAARNNRSMNSEIIHALEEHLRFKIDMGSPADPNDWGPESLRNGEPTIPISPEVRQSMELMIKQIADDAHRRLESFLWINEADEKDK